MRELLARLLAWLKGPTCPNCKPEALCEECQWWWEIR